MNNLVSLSGSRHRARKRFGQHFLYDREIIKSIVAAISPQPNQAIVEIGPGLGAITEPIAALVNTMTVIELDRNLAANLAATNHGLRQPKLNIMQQDALTVNFAALSAKLGQQLRIVGNLPYNISTKMIFHLFSYTDVILDMHLMLQKEVVHRLVAGINCKAYSRLSVITQYYCKVIKLMEVPRAYFIPAPKVDSAVVQFVPYATTPYQQVGDIKKLALITNMAFNQRRKTIRNSLRYLFSAEQLAKQGIDATLRAENVSIEQYCCLANMLG